MFWEDKGYLISKSKYNENNIIAEFYTEFHGKKSGLIFGATSKKIKNYLIIGNKFHLNFNTKNETKIGNFKVEIDKLNTPFYLEDKKRLFCIIYAMNLIKILTVENQENKNIYFLIENFFIFLSSNFWIREFILWELNVLKNIGYDLNFNDYVSNKNTKMDNSYIVKSNNIIKKIPNFLIDKKYENINSSDLYDGLKIVGDFLDKTVLKPNNIHYPASRHNFTNLIK